MRDKRPLTATEKKYENARELGILPANWVPPEQPELELTDNKRNNYGPKPDVIRQEAEKAKPNFADSKARAMDREAIAGDQTHIYPDEDNFKHVDTKELKRLREAVAGLAERPMTFMSPGKQRKEPKGQHDGSIAAVVAEPQANPQQLKHDLQEAEAQYKRLETAFKWVVSKICECCTALNEALKTNNRKAYALARQNYISLIQNLNIHDPEGDQIDPKGKAFGYGRVLGWTLVDVVVEPNKTYNKNLISGVTVVGEWIGYHTSSSGVPIPDKP